MMLQRAASHVQTKQSKWLEHNLKDAEEKVKYVLKLLEEDGDSFAKRAEMYYKGRPELINFVEESYKAYRALAERYDHISTELQNANISLASVLPDQVPQPPQEDDNDDGDIDTTPPRFNNKPTEITKSNIPIVPRSPKEDSDGKVLTVTKKSKPKKPVKENGDEDVEVIDSLQKEIPDLETEKSMNRIKENQEKLGCLQEEFDKSVVTKDGKARISMAVTTLKACQERLSELQEKQERTVKELEAERNRIRQSNERLIFLTDEILGKQCKSENSSVQDKSVGSDEKLEVDLLLNNLISLDTAVSSQTASIERLRAENDNLQEQIQTLEEEERQKKMNNKNSMRNNAREMEESLIILQDQDRNIEDKSNNLHMQITETCCNLNHLSANLPILKTNKCLDNVENTARLSKEEEQNLENQDDLEKKLNGMESEDKDQEQTLDNQDDLEKKFNGIQLEGVITVKQDAEKISQSLIPNAIDDNPENCGVIQEEDKSHCKGPKNVLEESAEREDVLLIKQLLTNKMEDREKMLLKEYTTILRNLKDMKKTLNESEKKRKADNTMKDDEIQSLQQRLSLLQENDDLIEPKFLKIREQDGLEEQIHMKIDKLLVENLDFCLRFSTYFSQIKKFNVSIDDLQIEISKLKDINKQAGAYTAKFALRSDVYPINKRLTEIRMELTVWSEKGALLKEELKSRYLSLSSIEDELRRVLNKSGQDFNFTITTYQAAKFQGEIANMKRENTNIANRLKAGLNQINTLQTKVEKSLVKLSKEFPHSGSKNRQQSANKPFVPLRSFLFEAKPKKHSLSSFFSFIHPPCLGSSNRVRRA